jgi:hypothetical protein
MNGNHERTTQNRVRDARGMIMSKTLFLISIFISFSIITGIITAVGGILENEFISIIFGVGLSSFFLSVIIYNVIENTEKVESLKKVSKDEREKKCMMNL